VGTKISTHLSLKESKEWLNKYESQIQKQKRGKSKMIIKEKCPKCDHPEMKYHVIQTRSADEGSTVFYECEKCGYTYSVNN
jgi:DNA-directed RNA polymerase subunit M/transcription elongation factor TFIIS